MATNNPKISIITVALNARDDLENTIKSVLAQTYKNIEYIIIDGNSIDGTFETIKKYNPVVTKWISEPDQGLFYAMNKGLSLATGDYVWFLNAGDEIYEPKTLERIMSLKNNADFYYGNIFVIGESFDDKDRLVASRKILNWKDAYKLKSGDLCHQTVIAKRCLAKEYDTHYLVASDIDWVINVLKKSKLIARFDGIVAKFLFGGFSFHNKTRSRYEFSKVIFKHGLYARYVFLMPRLFIFAPIDNYIGRIGMILKKRNQKLYYFIKSLLRIKTRPF